VIIYGAIAILLFHNIAISAIMMSYTSFDQEMNKS